MIDGGVDIMELPAIGGFLKCLEEHAGAEAANGQWGYYPGAKGEILDRERAMQVPGTEKWIGMPVCDANALVECYVGQLLEGTPEARMRYQYEEWCYGHVGELMEEMVQLPGGAVFRVDQQGRFQEVGYLYRKCGDGPFDWELFLCGDPAEGLCVRRMDESWNRWGLISMIMRYDLMGPLQEGLEPLPLGTPYAVVGSSVLNFRKKPGESLITSLPNGTVVRLTGRTDGDWTEVILGDIVGYVYSKFLEKFPEG